MNMTLPKIDIRVTSPDNTVTHASIIKGCIADTGASYTVLPSINFKQEFLKNLTPTRDLRVANSLNLPILGKALVRITDLKTKKTAVIKARVSTNVVAPLIGFEDLVRMGMLPQNFHTVCMVTKDLDKSMADKVKSLISRYNSVFDHQSMKPMDYPPLKLKFKTNVNVQPYHVNGTRPWPVNIAKEAKEHILDLERKGIIAKSTIASEWCAPCIFVPKPHGGIRMVTDFSKLSEYIQRPVHPFPSALDILKQLKPRYQWFAVIDVKGAYHQLRLHRQSQYLTCFLTPQGRYHYLRLAMGLSPSGDWFCLASDTALEGIEDLFKLVDDILVAAATQEEIVMKVAEVFQRCEEKGLTLNKEKLQIGQSVEFGGYIVTKDGYKPDPKKLSALSSFRVPTNLTDLRSFLGLCNQLVSGCPDLAHGAKPLYDLLKKDVVWQWTDSQQRAFNDLKRILTSDRVVGYYDPDLPVTLYTDASRIGLGYVALQENKEGKKKLIQCGSRSLVDCETRYSVSEIEMLAIYYAVNACKFFLFRSKEPTKIITDHKALVGIFRKNINELDNGRLLRFREKLRKYQLNVEWQAGKVHLMADCLSRSPLFAPNEQEKDEAQKMYDASVVFVVPDKDPRDPSLQELVQQHTDCQQTQDLMHAVGERDQAQVDKILNMHVNISEFSVVDKLLTYNNKLWVPKSYRNQLITFMHFGHPGAQRMISFARQKYFWPNLSNEIREFVAHCEDCILVAPSNFYAKRDHTAHGKAPMHTIACDLMQEKGSNYLVIVDSFSSYFWYFHLLKTTSLEIINKLRSVFIQFGFPTVFLSDNAKNLTSEEIDSFFKEFHILHLTNAPYDSRSNGQAESAIKRAKYLIKKTPVKNRDFEYYNLLNMPLSGKNVSPAELFFNRSRRNPLLPQISVAQQKNAIFAVKNDKELPTRPSLLTKAEAFETGDVVVVQDVPKSKNWDRFGFISRIYQDDLRQVPSFQIRITNSYPINDPYDYTFSGQSLWRSAKHIRLIMSASKFIAYCRNPETMRKYGSDTPEFAE